jgi:hypothetical protein
VFVDAPRVKYASDKEALMIEGDGRVLARVFLTMPGQSQPLSAQGQAFRYNLRSGELKPDGATIQFPLGAGVGAGLPGFGKK